MNHKEIFKVNCNAGFHLDTAGNTVFNRECIYNSDTYETEWITPHHDLTGEPLQCKPISNEDVQISVGHLMFQIFPE